MQDFDSAMQDDDCIVGDNYDGTGGFSVHNSIVGTLEVSDAADPF